MPPVLPLSGEGTEGQAAWQKGCRRGEKVALGWWRHVMLRWEPAARYKKVLKGVRI